MPQFDPDFGRKRMADYLESNPKLKELHDQIRQIEHGMTTASLLAAYPHAVNAIDFVIAQIEAYTGSRVDHNSFFKLIQLIMQKRDERGWEPSIEGEVKSYLRSGKSADQLFDWLTHYAWELLETEPK